MLTAILFYFLLDISYLCFKPDLVYLLELSRMFIEQEGLLPSKNIPHMFWTEFYYTQDNTFWYCRKTFWYELNSYNRDMENRKPVNFGIRPSITSETQQF